VTPPRRDTKRLSIILKNIATLGFIGYLPGAPGTFGSLCACVVFILISPSIPFHIIFLSACIIIGCISAHYAEQILQVKDSQHIVVDEFCGYFLAVLLVPFSVTYAVIAFFFFRLFDILKPFPIRSAEISLPGGIGIVADDLIAGLYTNIVMQLIHIIHKNL
jgi:phosphatidylglycerophosphatase A